MSYRELMASTNQEPQGSESPLLGGHSGYDQSADGVNPPTGARLTVRYFISNTSDESDRMMAEHIMTTSMNCANELRKIGDMSIFREDSTFDKSGNYMIAIKYCEVVPTGGVIETAKATIKTAPAPTPAPNLGAESEAMDLPELPKYDM